MLRSSRWGLPAVLVLFVQLTGFTPALAAAGQLDPSFGGDGKVTTHFAKGSDDEAVDVTVQPDGKLVAAGVSGQSRRRFALARYNPNGTLDPSFGGDGKVRTGFGMRSNDSASAMALQANGKIVVAGSSRQAHFRFALARYNPDGTLDPSFGGDGKVRTHFVRGSNDLAVGVAIQTDGKIVAAGFSMQSHDRFALARYQPDGTLDASFGGDGRVRTHFAKGSDDDAYGVAVQPNGRIVAAGHSFRRGSHDRFALARYLAA